MPRQLQMLPQPAAQLLPLLPQPVAKVLLLLPQPVAKVLLLPLHWRGRLPCWEALSEADDMNGWIST